MREKTQKMMMTVPVILAMLSLMMIPLPLAANSQNKISIPEYTMLQGGYSNLASETFTGTFNVTTIVGPDNSWKALEPLLESVQTSIYVEIYGFNDRDILDALWDIKTSIPSVDMKVLLGKSSLGYASPNDYVANNLTQDLGIPVRWTNDQWRYTHSKFVMIDNESVIIQSGNWAKTSFPNRDADEIGNREWSIAIHNPTVTAHYLDVFDLDWNQGTDYNIADGAGTPITNTTSTSGAAVHPFTTIGHYNEYMEITPVFSNDTSLSSILGLINSANSTLDIQIPYYTNFDEASVIDQIINATIDAAERGVAVRVITEEANKDNDDVALLFAEHGIPVVWFKETWFSALHNKGMIVDGVVVYLSSINFSEFSVSANREAGVIIRNSNVSSYYLAVFDYDWNRGEPANAVIQLTARPTTVTASDSVQVNASFFDFLGIQEAILSYRINTGLWSNVTMSNVTESALQIWNGIIPAQVDGTIVEYKVYARDSANDWFTSQTRSYTVGTGEPPPEDPDLFLILVGIGVVIATVIAVVVFKVKPTSGSKRKRKKR